MGGGEIDEARFLSPDNLAKDSTLPLIQILIDKLKIARFSALKAIFVCFPMKLFVKLKAMVRTQAMGGRH